MKGTRADLLPADHPLKHPPKITKAIHLQQYALELGLFKAGGMGLAPIDWVDIQAWATMTGTHLHPEEARILRGLSHTYVSWSNKAKEYDCPAPYFESETPATKGATVKAQMQRFRKSHQPRSRTK